MTGNNEVDVFEQLLNQIREHAFHWVKMMPENDVKAVLAEEGGVHLIREMFAPFGDRVTRRQVIVRPFRVDRTKTPEQIMQDFSRGRFDKDGIKDMPRQGVDEGQLYFFPHQGPLNELYVRFGKRGLIQDPCAQIQVNMNDPQFATEYPNSVIWIDSSGKLYELTTSRYNKKFQFEVSTRPNRHWPQPRWFAGRKIS